MHWLRNLLDRLVANPQFFTLVAVLAVLSALVLWIGDFLAPVIAALVIAFLLEGLVRPLVRMGMPRLVAVSLVCLLFVVLLVFLVLGLAPLLIRQVTDFLGRLPDMVASAQAVLVHLPDRYPHLLSEAYLTELLDSFRIQIASYGHQLVAYGLSSMRSVITFTIYLVLLPIMVFFFLKDKALLIDWFRRFLPEDHRLASKVWADIQRQVSDYVRGKILEILIVWVVTYITFLVCGLNYAMLLSLLVGLSVIIPYVGATVVTIPVAVVAYMQWGFESQFMVALGAYLVIQILDGNVLVPLLLSEVVNIHPIAVIASILVFGGLWGFWGVFFAIPLATVVQAVLNAWWARDVETDGAVC
ncbi:AI-2E family transporter [Thermodesulfomicrobium sp. WS]|uniref:AI-2E family transporter n=1 Tax=Thermodesulfomicrobium sp. WS TaxID=3004129 RepID=UPI0024916C82|nr:AI-2E family transporter [Thermodesulfomicrobium sp. WS]BDV01394.1 AI-2E family transporter [Thermodesulfomicrobium sp. WS]